MYLDNKGPSSDQADDFDPALLMPWRAQGAKLNQPDTLDQAILDTLKLSPSKLRQQFLKKLKLYEKNLSTGANGFNPVTVPNYSGPPVRAAIDAEWTSRIDAHGNVYNEVLCITMVIACDNKRSRYMFKPNGPSRDSRPTLKDFFQRALRNAQKDRVLLSMPDKITVYAHFMRGDLAAFRDFWGRKREFRGLGRTISSLRTGHLLEDNAPDDTVDDSVAGPWSGTTETPILRAINGQPFRVRLRFIDTIRLTPGQRGLDYVGQMVGAPKLDLHEDLGVPQIKTHERPEREQDGVPAIYGKERMDLVLRDFPGAFTDYAFRDTDITLDYALLMESFAKEQLGLPRLPPTISGCAIGLLRKLTGGSEALAERMGRTTVVESRFNEKARAYRTRSTEAYVPGLNLYYSFAQKFYHGGRNECFYHGPTTVGFWNDFDLPGAYTTALVALRSIDYDNIRQEFDPDAYGIDDMGLAWIAFEFPEGTRFPCIPVRSQSNALFFPLKGGKEDQVFVGAPEIFLARRMGAKITIINGIKAPWRSDERIFEDFTREIQSKRREYPKDQFPAFNELWKEIGNSCYGLMGQGLRDKKAFNPSTMSSESIGPSALTEPFLAAWTTSFVRAVLGEILAGVPDWGTVVSATTDGLLTDVPLESLCLDGPLCQYFSDLRARLFGSPEVLDPKPKHGARQVISVAVRTTFTARRALGYEPICAKGSVKPPCPREAANWYMLLRYMRQSFGDTVTHEQLISAREQFHKEADLYGIKRTRALHFTYDFKRKPVNARMVEIGRSARLAWDTVPWTTLQEAEFARTRVDGWRRDRKKIFGTMDDYNDWHEFFMASVATSEAATLAGVRPPPVRADNGCGLLKRLYLQAGRQELWGGTFASRQLTAIARKLTEAGFVTGKEDITYAGRRSTPLLPHCVALTPDTLALLRVLLQISPTFEYRQAFRKADFSRLETALAGG